MPVIGWGIAILVIGVQFYLSRRKYVYWGAILPVLYIVFIVGWFFKKFGEEDTLSLILAGVGGLAFLLSLWINGRDYLKKKRKKELEKIELQDI
ncbi:hypothetical protein SAMN05216187_10955 [Jeotgalicoccus aerolatus]|uniref:Uncharacterized protein n=1 Tax=Jeotgalicoccus aerolatus TaxID=709510 RepID=A0A1G9C905_9STAP|nr:MULTISPECIES: hypothetical protein [Bacillales]TQS75453.1 hypothetical protein DX933_06465 [Ornithinibacillus gellani]SDK48141.1 hypothetical protein SAMN05216187_10955 [Jeotgalicoccus aerolatus]